MAIDPNKETPSDVASISSLQSMTEESAKAAMRAGVDGSFGGMKINLLGLLDGLLGGLIEKIKEYLKNPGKILEDGLDLIGSIGGSALGALMALGGGFIDLIKDIGSSIVSLFPGTNQPTKPLPPVYSDIRTNLEGEIKPFVDEFNRHGELVDEAHENIGQLQSDYEAQSGRVDQYIQDTDAKIEAIGDVDAKIADTASGILGEVADAQSTAEEGVRRSKEINKAITANPNGDGDLEAAWRDQKDNTDEAQNTALDALARAVRLAFPDINLLPYVGNASTTGYARWQTGASWVSTSFSSSDFPPVGKRSEGRTYVVAGSGTQAKTASHAIDLPKDVREFRLRGYVRAASGYSPSVRVLDEADQDLVTAWRNTAPSNDDAISENFASGWVSTPNAGGGPMNTDSVSDWVLYDQVVRIKDGAEKAWITLTTPSTSDSAYVHGLRMTVFYPVQAEVDFGQQQAINGLKKMVDINNGVTAELTKITTAQGEQLEMLREIQKTQGEMVMRSMVMNLNSNVSSYLDDDGVFFRVYNNDNNVDVRALNTAGAWVGKAIFTLVFGTQHETAITQFSIPEGTSRDKVVSTQTRANRKMARLDWWVYAKVQERAGSTRLTPIVAPLGWSTLTDHNFPVQTTTDHIIGFSVNWENTTRSGKVYGIRIRRDGTILKELTEKNIGPNFPWESGKRTQSIMWSGNLTAGQNITFEVYTGADGTSAPSDSQRTLGKRSNVVTWMEDRKD